MTMQEKMIQILPTQLAHEAPILSNEIMQEIRPM